ncbi:MAG: ATP-binding cassette domain-containing protein [Candidatus Kapabacteria bacterium]|nr:ATP-binding cassette domain-containing protein [Candidatus Kapabacteria bacterium]MDW8011752.1 ATP-binding cassette domain-containing protein [Bacteroidota bacterium]
MVEARGLWKRYGQTVALQECSFTFRTGQVVGLLGPNGAGKTTLLRLLASILLPDAGQILFEGEPLQRRHQRLIGYLPEERGLYRHQRVEDQLLYFARLRGLPLGQARQAIGYWLERLGVIPWRHSRISELSKGIQQKVQLAAALLHQPHLLLLDEPTSGLDPVDVRELSNLLQELRSEGQTIVLSTHRMEQAEELCDAIIFLHRGRIALSGSIRDIKQQWGPKTLVLEFCGDITPVLQQFPNAHLLRSSRGHIELQWHGDLRSLPTFLQAVVQHVELYHLAWTEPSIEAIFRSIVGEDSVPQLDGTGTPSPMRGSCTLHNLIPNDSPSTPTGLPSS